LGRISAKRVVLPAHQPPGREAFPFNLGRNRQVPAFSCHGRHPSNRSKQSPHFPAAGINRRRSAYKEPVVSVAAADVSALIAAAAFGT